MSNDERQVVIPGQILGDTPAFKPGRGTFVENKKIAAHTIGAGDMKNTDSWTVEPTAKGTKLTTSMDYELPYSLLGKLVDKVRVSKFMEKTMSQTQENIKKALEA